MHMLLQAFPLHLPRTALHRQCIHPQVPRTAQLHLSTARPHLNIVQHLQSTAQQVQLTQMMQDLLQRMAMSMAHIVQNISLLQYM